MTAIAFFGHEIGEKDTLSRKAAFRAAYDFALIAARMPGVEHMIMLAGYDDDPRELWDIPEARDYIRQFTQMLRGLVPDRKLDEWGLDGASISVLAMCVGAAKIIGRDQETGEYTIKIDLEAAP